MNVIDQLQSSMLNQMEQMKQASSGEAIRPANLTIDNRTQADFGDALERVVLSVDAQQKRAGEMTQAISTGQSEDLVGAMVESQKANLSFTALLQVRNKLSEAFNEVMRMPI